MDKVAYFKITRLKISRFKSHVEETEYHFGDLTMISGGNHTGKTTIADAIAWVMIGQGFFGGHLLDRFYNDKERKKRIAVELEYVDASGIRHVLSRQRINDKVDAALDGSAIRQKDLNAMFGDADEFLSLVNPLYFVEILAEKGRGLLERNLPPVSQEEVLQRLNGDSQKALEGYSFLSPEAALSNLRAKQREIADAMLALDSQSDLLAQQNQECQDRIQALQMEIKALSEQIVGLEAKQKTGIDEGALRLELASLTMRYDEMLNEKPLAFDPAAYRIREMELRTRLSEAERRTFESKFAQEIAVQEKALASMRNRYHQMAAFLTALKPGIICPQCRRPVNIVLDKESEIITLEDAAYNPIVDSQPYFDQVQESFQLYRRCVNRRQMDTVLGKMLDDMEAVKIQSRGGMYFVPRQHMARIDVFEDFLETMNEHALSENQVDVNSMYVVDNERQREKMSHEFYVALKKEIETDQERASHLINTGCESPAIMARWVSKICELGEKRRRYEDLFQRQISEVDGEFNTLQGFARELQVRIDHAHLKPLRPCA